MPGGVKTVPSPGRGQPPSHLVIGRILGPHGTRGEVVAQVLTDFPDRFGLLKRIYLGQRLSPAILEGHRFHKSRVILKLAGCDSRNEAEALRGELVQVPIDEAMPLKEDEYYVYQVLGLEAWTTAGEFLGRVDDVLTTGSNDVYVVRDGDREILIPAISDAVTEVDIRKGRLTVYLLEGLR